MDDIILARDRLRQQRARVLGDGEPRIGAHGKPVQEVWKASTVMFNKRSLAPTYAGIDNMLFYRDITIMLLGDAKKLTEEIARSPGH